MSVVPAPDTIEVETEGAVTILTLNRPQALNALTGPLMAELTRALATIADEPRVRCVVLTGAGRGFCSGQALDEYPDTGALADRIGSILRERYLPLLRRLRDLDRPVVAAVNGVAAGAGLSLALACDLRLASDAATFTCGFSRVGLVPDAGATFFLPRVVGHGRAFEVALRTERIDAQEALRLGLVNQVFPAASFREAVRAFAADLAAGPTRALALTKRALSHSLEATLEEQLEIELTCQQLAGQTDDFREAVAAFQARRAPHFTGQ
ncbi:MAG TPA: enoyl-CoA hydratase-related protein [Candidatus Dormibacteraeota bacterium]|nr:enoyl-CoA hydratase-related protein [Candidatus Dormibacteraeota bacterium]